MIGRRVVASLAVVAVLGVLAPRQVRADLSTADATPTPEQLYANAQRTWTAHVPPAHLAYTIAVTETHGAVARTRHYRVNADTLDGTIAVEAISDEETHTTANVTGVRVIAALKSHGRDFKKQLTPTDADVLGVPQLAPDYSFGIARRRLTDFTATPEPAAPPDANGVTAHEIGRVSTTARRYSITLAGNETIDARAVYHLRLVPLHDPARYRLRDLWIDAATTDVVQLRSDGNFDSKFTRGVPWLVTFRGDGDARYIAREVAEKPIDFGDNRRYDTVEIAFGDITPLRIAPVTLGAAPSPGFATLREP